MLRHVHFGSKGGKETFAASAKSKGQLEESGRSGLRPSFSMSNASKVGSEPIAHDAADGTESPLKVIIVRQVASNTNPVMKTHGGVVFSSF
jgi:hypothetical protein